MANLYGYVSTDPNALLRNSDTIGDLNDYYIQEMVKLSDIQLCGWGSFKPVPKRAPIVYKMLPNPHCVGTNADGQPKHPLYVGYDVPMKKYSYVVKSSIL
jgi:hypothetical protein